MFDIRSLTWDEWSYREGVILPIVTLGTIRPEDSGAAQNAGLEIRSFLQSSTAKNVQEWQKNLLAIQMSWQFSGHPRTKAIFRTDSFHSGMAVSLTCQSCGLACPQGLILPLKCHGVLALNCTAKPKSPAVWACLGVDHLDMPRTPYRASEEKRSQ